jgi:predicted nucleotidyltransferase component of viral defense system
MRSILEYAKDRIINKNELINDYELFISEIREIMQEIILPGLAETNFFDNNVFQGGTAIRMLYGLKRYSDDLDFTMKENKIEDFSWKTYADHLIEYGKNLGIVFNCKEDKDKFGNKIIRKRRN